jgi:TIR domain
VRIFISFAHDDADLAAQLEAALRSNIDTWSTLDIAPGEDWTQAIDKKSASADGYVFLLGPGAPENPQLRAEWRSLLRNDWESKKSLIPVILAHGSVPHDLPPSCGTGGRSSQPISTTRSARSAT